MKLNDTNTEFIIFGMEMEWNGMEWNGKVAEWAVDVHDGDATILPSGSVRNIGAMLNPTLIWRHTSSVSMKRACYIQLRSLFRIRKHYTQEATVN